MHKHQTPASTSGKRAPESHWCKAGQDGADIVVTTVFAWAGPAVARHLLPEPRKTSASAPVYTEQFLSLTRAPFSPPPRG